MAIIFYRFELGTSGLCYSYSSIKTLKWGTPWWEFVLKTFQLLILTQVFRRMVTFSDASNTTTFYRLRNQLICFICSKVKEAGTLWTPCILLISFLQSVFNYTYFYNKKGKCLYNFVLEVKWKKVLQSPNFVSIMRTFFISFSFIFQIFTFRYTYRFSCFHKIGCGF